MGRPEESKILSKLMRRSTREVAFKIENSKVGGTRNLRILGVLVQISIDEEKGPKLFSLFE